MPSQVIDDPVINTFPGPTTYYVSGFHRNRSWTNASPSWKAYSGLPGWQQPVNSYNDETWRIAAAETCKVDIWYLGSPYTAVYHGISDAFGGVAPTFNVYLNTTDNVLASQSRLQNEAVIKLLRKAADVNANLPVCVAEAKKTTDHILHTARRILEAWKAFRRGDLVRLARELGISPSRLHKSWLEYRYGWLPLLMDIKGAAEGFAKANFPRKPIFRVAGKAEETKTVNSVATNQYGIFGHGRATVRYDCTASRKVKAVAWLEYQSRSFATAQQWGLTNPALLAWEVIPFSFVFDWIISVGDWLTALTALNGLIALSAFQSTETTFALNQVTSEPDFNDSGILYKSYSYSAVCTKRIYNRSAITISANDVYPPVDRDPFNWTRLTSGLALIKAQAHR